MSAVIEHIFLKVARGQPMEAVSQAVAEAGRGLVGDLAYGSRRRQVLLIDSETLDDFDLAPGAVRENLTSSGLDPSQLSAGARLRVGEALLQITGNCAPCNQLEDLRVGLREAMDGRRGLLAEVLEGGPIRTGDPIQILKTEAQGRGAPAPSSD